MTPLPLTHMNAMACSTMVVLVAGGCLVQLDRFHPRSWLQSARESGATVVHYLGVMPAMLLAAPPSPADRDHAIRWAFGAGVDPKHHAAFEERFGFPLVEAWAMTETGVAACIMANREPRLVGRACFGRQPDFVEVRLVDDAGQPSAAGDNEPANHRNGGLYGDEDGFVHAHAPRPRMRSMTACQTNPIGKAWTTSHPLDTTAMPKKPTIKPVSPSGMPSCMAR